MKEGLFCGIDAENYGGNAFECACGSMHKIATEKVIFSVDGFSKFVNFIKAKLGFVRVLIVVREECNIDCAKQLEDVFLSKDFFVRSYIMSTDAELDVERMPSLRGNYEQERLIVAVGGAEVCDFIKYYCTRYSLYSAYCCTGITSNTYLSKFAYVLKKGKIEKVEIKPLDYFVVDHNVYNFLDERNIALSYQTVVCQFLHLYNWQFESCFDRVFYCKNIVKLVMQSITKTLESSEGAIHKELGDCIAVAENALRINIAVALMENSGYCENLVNDILYVMMLIRKYKKSSANLIVESELLVCLLITDIYELYLSKNIADILAPPNLNERALILSKLFSRKLLKVLIDINKPESFENYELKQYKFDEYREDFKTRVNNMARVFHFAFNQYKRIYFDTGYFLHKAIDHQELMLAVNLVNDISNGYTLLKHIVRAGLLEKYVTSDAI